jgi:hypothetical protein
MTTRDVKERILQFMGAPVEKIDKWKFYFQASNEMLVPEDSTCLNPYLEQLAQYPPGTFAYIAVDQGVDGIKRRSSIHDSDRSIKIKV